MNRRWDRRTFLQISAGASLLPLVDLSRPAALSAAEPDVPPAQDSPVRHLYWAWWGWEPLAHYRRATGIIGAVDTQAPWLEQWHARLHSEELAAKMADLGINLAVTHFFKGFGLRHEQAEQQRSADMVRFAHAHGIRVLGYCQSGSLYHETFLQEQPDAEDWVQRDPKGRLRYWSGQKYRWAPCIHSRSFREYMKRAIGVGLREIGFDGLFFDNDYSNPCYCSHCEEAFRAWIAARGSEVFRELKIDAMEAVRLPAEAMPASPIEDPLVQAWVRFRCESLAEYHRELAEHARSLRPDVILEGNPACPRTYDEPYRRSVWMPWLGRHLDLFFAENGNFPGMDGDAVISQIRAYKMAAAVGYRAVSTTWRRRQQLGQSLPGNPAEIGLQLAEAAAYGGVPGLNWALRPGNDGDRMQIDRPELHEAAKRYLGFLRRHEDLTTGAEPVRDLAVWHSFASEAWDLRNRSVWLGTEETLIRGGFPWEVVVGDNAGRLDGFAVLILAGQTHWSDADATAIRGFVERGGRLLVVGENGRLDEHGRQRPDDPLAGLPEERLVRVSADLARAAVDYSKAVRVTLPEAWAELAAAVERALGDRPSVRLLDGDTVALSAYRRASHQLVVHLVNYAAPEPRSGMRLRLGPDWQRARRIRLLSPDGPEQTLSAAGAIVQLPPLAMYAIVVAEA